MRKTKICIAVLLMLAAAASGAADNDFAPGPVLYLDGYTYYSGTDISGTIDVNILKNDLDHMYRIADTPGAKPEIVYTTRNHNRSVSGEFVFSRLTPFLWRGEIWFFEREEIRAYDSNGIQIGWDKEFILNRIDKKTGNAVAVPLGRKNGKFILRSEPDGLPPPDDTPVENPIANITAIGAAGNVVYCSVGLQISNNSYIIAIDMESGRVSQIDAGLHNGDRIAAIGVYNNIIYYVRLTAESGFREALICGQAAGTPLLPAAEKIYARLGMKDADLYSSYTLQRFVSSSTNMSGRMYLPMKDGVVHFVSSHVPIINDRIDILSFDASSNALTSVANVDINGLRMADMTAAAAGNSVFYSANYGQGLRITETDINTGNKKIIAESGDENLIVFGITDKHLYYLGASTGGDGGFSLNRVDIHDTTRRERLM